MWKTQQERINELQTPAKYYLQNLYDALADAIVINNDALPEHLRQYKEWDFDANGDRVYGSTVAEINRRLS